MNKNVMKDIIIDHLEDLEAYSHAEIRTYVDAIDIEDIIDAIADETFFCLDEYSIRICPDKTRLMSNLSGCTGCNHYVEIDMVQKCVNWNKGFKEFTDALRQALEAEYFE